MEAHSTGYRRFLTGFELKLIFKGREVIKGQNNVFFWGGAGEIL